ncbi:MAG: NAD(P)/FAD-dependent oxidoreductase [Alphaproteobacteria bacterium]|nr:NAD(P)/FAD-dependent oxidoreductase [Alphaproteobacteria bacterium]
MKNIIIGCGPAGITAAYELAKHADMQIELIEKSSHIGGMSATMNFDGNKLDLGPHRFFTKSDRVQKLWETVLPLQGHPTVDDIELEHNLPFSKQKNAPDPQKTDNVLLTRPRLTRIYYRKKFFDYPVSLSLNTIKGLGLFNMALIGLSYFKSLLHKRKEISLEDFFINRFGAVLYKTFFKDYTEKLWGINCKEISAEWGAQRVKGISIAQILKEILGKLILRKKFKTNQTSLIEAFYYPKLGAGQMYEQMAKTAQEKGADLRFNTTVEKIKIENNQVKSVTVNQNGKLTELPCDTLISSMPIQELVAKIDGPVPAKVAETAQNLSYRNIRLATFLLTKLKLKNTTKLKTYNNLIPDVWIYIQEKGGKAGRMEIINNFSPYLVKNNKDQVCITVEYFCSDTDEIWTQDEDDFLDMVMGELEQMDIAAKEDFISRTSYKIEKAYPAYFGAYKDFGVVKDYLNSVTNLYPIGRNGMHKYNNMDHSILTALETVDCITRSTDKSSIWEVNTEQAYHEQK